MAESEFDLFDHSKGGDVTYNKDQHARNLVKWLFSDLKLSKQIISPQVIKALLIKKDFKYLDGVASVIQEALENLAKDPSDHIIQCQAPDGSVEAINQKDIVIGNLLSIYALLCEPANNDKLFVPVQVNNQWERVEYRVKRIQLTPAAFGEPYFAYGLEPKNKAADAKLLFGGTNPIPTATGSLMTMIMDLFPGMSAGRFAYNMSKKNIQHWVKQQYSNSGSKVKVTAAGVSLGGSLSLIAHIEQPTMVNARAYVPPGLLANEATRYEKRKKEAGITDVDKDAVKIYTQANDFVFRVGTYFPESADIYEISPNENAPKNKLYNHMKCFMAGSPVSMRKLDNEKVNNTFQRWFYTLLWQTLAVPFIAWSAIYITLKVLTYPLRTLINKINGDVDADQKNRNINISLGQKIFGGVLKVLAAIIVAPIVVANLAITLALGTIALVAFGLFNGIGYVGNLIVNHVKRNKNISVSTSQGAGTFFEQSNRSEPDSQAGTSTIFKPPKVNPAPNGQ